MSISISVVFGEKKIGNSNRAKDTVHIDNPLYELFRLIQFHVNSIPDFQQRVNFETLLELGNRLKKPIELIPGDMLNWIGLYLDMVNLLLNIIRFQRSGNCDWFLYYLKKFLILLCFEQAQLRT